MAEKMTLEKLRDWHKRESKRGTGPDPWFHDDFHNSAAILLDAHLARPSQAVDVDTVISVCNELRYTAGGNHAWRVTLADKLTRAIGNASTTK